MLSQNNPDRLSFAETQPGDEFYLVGTSRFTGAPVSVTFYQVLRAGKRDIVYTAIDSGFEKRIARTATLQNAYLTKEEVVWAEEAIRLNKKQLAAWRAIETNKSEAIPEDLADRIIAWGQALESQNGKSRE
ncbi:hypothetical protein HAP94_06370 [Acidithiobacillus ferrivorans]|nr:hypothetical protein [Acidithiobacillus ferrivorans]